MRLIATDLDGTFLGEGATVSAGNLAAARRAIDSGVEFVVATGRPTRWLAPLDPLRNIAPKVIASNGAAVVDLGTNELLHTHPIDPEVMLTVGRDLVSEIPSAAFAIEYGRGWAHEPGYGRRAEHDNAHRVAPLAHLDLDGVVKLLVWSRDLGTEELSALIEPVVGDRLTVTFSFLSESGLIELSAPGISKATALAEVLDDLSIPADEAVAFGDMPNDIEMLRLVGRGFVPRNAHPVLLEAGFEVVGHHAEDGVGNAISQLLDENASSTRLSSTGR